jgi:hypothetical protein
MKSAAQQLNDACHPVFVRLLNKILSKTINVGISTLQLIHFLRSYKQKYYCMSQYHLFCAAGAFFIPIVPPSTERAALI